MCGLRGQRRKYKALCLRDFPSEYRSYPAVPVARVELRNDDIGLTHDIFLANSCIFRFSDADRRCTYIAAFAFEGESSSRRIVCYENYLRDELSPAINLTLPIPRDQLSWSLSVWNLLYPASLLLPQITAPSQHSQNTLVTCHHPLKRPPKQSPALYSYPWLWILSMD